MESRWVSEKEHTVGGLKGKLHMAETGIYYFRSGRVIFPVDQVWAIEQHGREIMSMCPGRAKIEAADQFLGQDFWERKGGRR